jgi:hypothetical protein
MPDSDRPNKLRDVFLSLGVSLAVAAINYLLVLIILLGKEDAPRLVPHRTLAGWVTLYAPTLVSLINSLIIGVTGSLKFWKGGLFVAVVLYVVTIGYALSS